MLGRLSLVDKHQLRGLVDGYLAYHLATDAAGRTCNHDALARELLAYRLHVDLYLIAWQQILDAYLLQLRCRWQLPAFQLLGILCNVNTYAGIYELVLQVFPSAEVAQTIRSDDERLDMVGLHLLHQMLVGHVHLSSHEHMTIHARLNSGKALQVEAHGFLAAYVLGNGDAIVLHAEDVGTLGTLTGKENVVEHLYADAQHP